MLLDLSKPIDIQKALAYFQKLMEEKSKIELKKKQPKRTIHQNAYLHVIFGLISLETGYTIEETKIVIKRDFKSFMVYEKDGNKFLRSTSDLDTKEMTIFIDWLRQFALENFGRYIPTPDEYYQNQFEVDKELEHIF